MNKPNIEIVQMALISVNAAGPIDTTHNVDVKADCMKWLAGLIIELQPKPDTGKKKTTSKKKATSKKGTG